MYAIIATGGKQYKVSVGDIITIEKLAGEPGDTVVFDQVLAISDEGSLKVGEEVASAKVNATLTEQGKAKKVIVYKYKPKKGYHKKNGHRQLFSKVLIDSIQA